MIAIAWQVCVCVTLHDPMYTAHVQCSHRADMHHVASRVAAHSNLEIIVSVAVGDGALSSQYCLQWSGNLITCRKEYGPPANMTGRSGLLRTAGRTCLHHWRARQYCCGSRGTGRNTPTPWDWQAGAANTTHVSFATQRSLSATRSTTTCPESLDGCSGLTMNMNRRADDAR